MWPEKLIDPDGQEVAFVRYYGNMAEYQRYDGKTLWVTWNSVGDICHGADIYKPQENKIRRCVEC